MQYNKIAKEVIKMEQFFKKMGWTSILTSFIFAILGLIIAYYPNTTFQFITYIIGAIFIAIGIIKIIEYFKAKGSYDLYNYELVYGIIAILLGLVVIVCSNLIEAFLRIAIGIWIIYSGAMRLGLSVKLQKLEASNAAWGTVLLIAIAMILCGLYIITVPGAIIATIGILMVVYSIMDIIEEVIFMQNIKNRD